MTAVDEGWLESRPRGTVVKVTTASGHSFQLVAEGGAFGDFVLHGGTAPYGFQGQIARYGRVRLYWSTDRLAEWVAEGRCRIELVSTDANRAQR